VEKAMSNPKENGWGEVLRVRLSVNLDQLVRRNAHAESRSAPQEVADMVLECLTYRKVLGPLVNTDEFDHIKESILRGGESK
jgi:hypothetical protein